MSSYCILQKITDEMKKKLMWMIILPAIICICSCHDSYTICNSSKVVNFTAGFYRHTGGVDVSQPAPSFSLFLLNGSSPVYSTVVNATSFTLPLNPATDSAKYLISVTGSSPDTLTIVYTTQSVNLSLDCGNIFENNITALRTTTHTLDSVKIVQPVITNEPLENARIYF